MQGQQQQIAQHSAVVPPASSPTLEEDFRSGGRGGGGVRVPAAMRSCRLLEGTGDERITIWPAIGERKWRKMVNLASGE